ncbi:hydrogenase maturation protease [Caldithrix abyssi DSM 13497]|uniref:Hydrogenase maturation protease n=2 Tax=Caldithrix abyssi DSM 13497 TaxID=880073 RepID=H1XW85_CALAY|nr:hydrogenase maturation protease [Caldithrix abyssi]EHO42990.1 hydrogenase maturation protease [Caldithrix abyssi DSM 13497]
MKRKKISDILILGIGNVLMGDEGIGAFIAQFLEKQKLPPGVTVLDGGTGGFHLLETFQNADCVILIDATINGQPPASWERLQPRYSSDYPPTLTAHDIGLKDMLDAAQLLGKMPKVVLYAISIDSINSVKFGLSPELEAIIPVIGGEVLNEVHDLLGAPV